MGKMKDSRPKHRFSDTFSLLSLFSKSRIMCTIYESLLDVRVSFSLIKSHNLVGYTARCQMAVDLPEWPYRYEVFILYLSHWTPN